MIASLILYLIIMYLKVNIGLTNGYQRFPEYFYSVVPVHSGTFETNFFQITKSYIVHKYLYSNIHPPLRLLWVLQEAYLNILGIWIFMIYALLFNQIWEQLKQQ